MFFVTNHECGRVVKLQVSKSHYILKYKLFFAFKLPVALLRPSKQKEREKSVWLSIPLIYLTMHTYLSEQSFYHFVSLAVNTEGLRPGPPMLSGWKCSGEPSSLTVLFQLCVQQFAQLIEHVCCFSRHSCSSR